MTDTERMDWLESYAHRVLFHLERGEGGRVTYALLPELEGAAARDLGQLVWYTTLRALVDASTLP